ncbi:hypothetical protein BSLG_008489 [Batrachochytrium salamandrivorans]|nr:hypothetical protein BSLG_008489 [Batrachochytrium salamandrivorans]
MSSTLYSLCKEIFPPSGIDHAVSARFLAPDSRSVIIARGSLLQVYLVLEQDVSSTASIPSGNADAASSTINGDHIQAGNHSHDQESGDTPKMGARMELSAQFRLHGNITSMGVVPMGSSDRTDALLLGFKDAKMSLVEFSRTSQKLVTVSMHLFERDEFKKQGSIDRPPPDIRVDPQGRCAAMRIYGDKLAILPFKHDGASLHADLNDTSNKYPFLPSIVLPFLALDKSIRNVVDFTFLLGYAVPAIAIMCQTSQTWTGRLGVLKDTMSVIVISLDTVEKSYPVLYRIENLPYNCTMLVPVPTPIGGLIILSHNAIIYTDQIHTPGVACIVNAYFDRETHLLPTQAENLIEMSQAIPSKPQSLFYLHDKFTDYQDLGISLDGSRGMFLSPDIFLLVLRDGEMIQLDIIGEDGVGRSWKRRKGGVSRFQLTRLGIRMASPVHLFPLTDDSNPLGMRISGSAMPTLGGVFRNSKGAKLRYNYLFVASRAADAELIQFVEVEETSKTRALTDASANMSDDELDDDLYGDSSSSKRLKDESSLKLESDGLDTSSSLSDPVRFRVCDSVVVVCPLRDFTVGVPAEASLHPFTPKLDTCDLEVVSATGDGPHGSLVVLNRNVRPQIISTFELPQIEEMWSIRCVKGNHDDSSISHSDDAFHKYVVLSHASGTSILRTGDEFTEMDDTSFYQAGPTVGVGTLVGETIIVQVHPNGILVFDHDGMKLQDMSIGNDDLWVVSCSFMDPYVMLHMNAGNLMLLRVDNASRLLSHNAEYKRRLVSAFSLYCDPTGETLLPTNEMAIKSHASMLSNTSRKSGINMNSTAKRRPSQPINLDNDLADEDMDLYGSSLDRNGDYEMAEAEMDVIYGSHENTDLKAQDSFNDNLQDTTMDDDQADVSRVVGQESHEQSGSASVYFGFVYTDTGHLLVYRLPQFEECCAFPYFSTLPTLAMDVPFWRTRDIDSTFSNATGDEFDEILAVNLGSSKHRQIPYLICLAANGDLTAYKMFVCPADIDKDDTVAAHSGPFKRPRTSAELDAAPQIIKRRLAIRLLRIPHDQITRNLQFYTDTDGDKIDLVDEPQRQPTFLKKQHLKPFDAVGWTGGNMYTGVMVTGSHPCWIMTALCSRQLDLQTITSIYNPAHPSKYPAIQSLGTNMLRFHPMSVDGPVKCFAPLHNMNVANGFLYINWKGLFRICQLPPQFNFDHDWPVCKVPINRTVHKITYHYASQTYVIATSIPERFDIPRAQYASAVAAAVIDDGDILPDAERRVTGIRELADIKPGMYEATVDRYRVELVSPVTWETVDSVELSEAESVLALESVDLASKETSSGKKLYVAIGTGYSRSEDLSSRGKMHLYDIIEVVPDPSNPQTNRKFKHVDTEEDRSPFSAICTVNDYLLAAIGPKIIMYQLEDGDISGVAFMDVNVFIVSLSSAKNLIQICDIHKSIWFVAFQEEPAKLAILGRDVHPLLGYAANMLIDDNQLGLLVADGEKNLHLMTYSPHNVQSVGGERLIRKGEMHLGQHVSKLVRMRRKPLVRNNTLIPSKQYMNLASTLDGALEIITPVSERIFKRLYGLYSRMVSSVEHVAGLNPRGFRQIQHRVRPIALSGVIGPPGPRGILDGDLLYEYANLSRIQQRSLAKAIGSKDDRLMDDLLEVLSGIDYF